MLLMVDPSSVDPAAVLSGLDSAFPKAPKLGGTLSGIERPGDAALFLNDRLLRRGALGLAFRGRIALDTVIAQACRPVGEPMIITRCRDTIIQELNAVGIGTANKLRESGYENVWYDPKTKEKMFYMTPEQRRAIVPGYMVGTQNRDAILAKVEEVLRNKRLRIYSTRFVNQLETFMWNGKRAESAKRKNDDLVMALAIGLDNFEPNQQESIYTNSIAKENKSWANAFLKSISSRSKTLDQQKYGAHATQNTAAQAARVAGQPNHLGQPDQQQRTPQSLQAGKRNYLTQRAMFPWMFD